MIGSWIGFAPIKGRPTLTCRPFGGAREVSSPSIRRPAGWLADGAENTQEVPKGNRSVALDDVGKTNALTWPAELAGQRGRSSGGGAAAAGSVAGAGRFLWPPESGSR